MHPSIHQFAGQFARAVAAALIPVVLTAFLSIPYNLGGHPGEGRPVDRTNDAHMT
jgi:hypothetical protein